MRFVCKMGGPKQITRSSFLCFNAKMVENKIRSRTGVCHDCHEFHTWVGYAWIIGWVGRGGGEYVYTGMYIHTYTHTYIYI